MEIEYFCIQTVLLKQNLADKQQYSELELKRLVQQLASQPARNQTDAIVNTVKSWCDIEQFEDDISLLAFEWKGN